jgi:hypothetical protein
LQGHRHSICLQKPVTIVLSCALNVVCVRLNFCAHHFTALSPDDCMKRWSQSSSSIRGISLHTP